MVNPLWVLTRRRAAALDCQAARTEIPGHPSPGFWVGGTVASSAVPATGRDLRTVFGDSTFNHFPVTLNLWLNLLCLCFLIYPVG